MRQKHFNASVGQPYQNQIFLNETDHLFYNYNLDCLNKNLPQVHYIEPESIAPEDLKLYFRDTFDKHVLVFITNSDCVLINTPTYIPSVSKYRATHTFTSAQIPIVSPVLAAATSTPAQPSSALPSFNLGKSFTF